MFTIDATGQPCPKPIMLTKKAIDSNKTNETLQILVDNETALKNVCEFLKEYNIEFTFQKKDKIFEIVTGTNINQIDQKELFEPNKKPNNNNYIISIQKNTLGNGPDDLGRILMSSFLNTLPETKHLPTAIIFLNTGIHLTCNNSDVIQSLKKLELGGTSILVCGTCIDYFNKKDELAVGKISNMFQIMELFTQADKIIYP